MPVSHLGLIHQNLVYLKIKNTSKSYRSIAKLICSLGYLAIGFGGKIRCQICGKQFSNRQNARRHVKEQHEGGKFVCHVCQMVFNRREHLNRHISRKHQSEILLTPAHVPEFLSDFNQQH